MQDTKENGKTNKDCIYCTMLHNHSCYFKLDCWDGYSFCISSKS